MRHRKISCQKDVSSHVPTPRDAFYILRYATGHIPVKTNYHALFSIQDQLLRDAPKT